MAEDNTADAPARDPIADAAAAARAAAEAARQAAGEMTVKARLQRVNRIISDPDFQAKCDQLAILGPGIGGNIEAILDNNSKGIELLYKQVPEAILAQK